MQQEPPSSSGQSTAPAPIALLGFGEAGAALADGWRQAGFKGALTAYDVKAASTDNAISAAMWDRYKAHHVTGADQVRTGVANAKAVFSVVTADEAHAAACATAAEITPGSLFFDMNSCAPETKRASAKVIEAAGGRYVDTAIMAPINPRRHETPMLISGPHVEAAQAAMAGLAMTPRIIEGDVGRASSIKMLRSVMIKGIEALTLESLLAARRAGVETEVLASLDASMPGWNWTERAAYNMERTTTHGLRRAAEMREVVRTVADLDLPPRMAASIVDWQQDMGDLGLTLGADESFTTRADAILARLSHSNMEEKP